jgi:Pyruvate/2-oxoacid:ferredoxin oxidoreductase gamma subunit
VSFELLESLRYADLLAPDGTAVINRQTIIPVTVSSGQQPWPEDLDDRIARAFAKRHLLDALAVARELGNVRVVSMVMAGALSALLDLDEKAWHRAMEELVPPRHHEVNHRATAGRSHWRNDGIHLGTSCFANDRLPGQAPAQREGWGHQPFLLPLSFSVFSVSPW